MSLPPKAYNRREIPDFIFVVGSVVAAEQVTRSLCQLSNRAGIPSPPTVESMVGGMNNAEKSKHWAQRVINLEIPVLVRSLKSSNV